MVPSGAQRLDAFPRLLDLEPKSTHIALNQPLYIPGLFQTRGYATAILAEISGLAPDSTEVRNRVDVRLGRVATLRERLAGPRPPAVTVVLDESVLHRAFGGPAVMREQLEYLADTVSSHQTITLGVRMMADGGHAGLAGPFEVHERPDAEAAIFLEVPQYPVLVLDDDALVQRCQATMERLLAQAVRGRKAVEAIEKISASL